MFGSMFQKKPEVDLAQKNVSVRSPDEIQELEKLIKSGPVTFVFVHADWCGHCQTYKPIWNELLSVPGRSANMGMIHHDMVEKSPLLKNAKIPGYPTVLKVYSNGHLEKYKGENNEMTNDPQASCVKHCVEHASFFVAVAFTPLCWQRQLVQFRSTFFIGNNRCISSSRVA